MQFWRHHSNKLKVPKDSAYLAESLIKLIHGMTIEEMVYGINDLVAQRGKMISTSEIANCLWRILTKFLEHLHSPPLVLMEKSTSSSASSG